MSDRFHASRPDLVLCYKGRYIAIEVKIDKAQPTALQKFTLLELKYAGAAVYILNYHKKTKVYVITSLDGEVADFTDIKDGCSWLLRPRS